MGRSISAKRQHEEDAVSVLHINTAKTWRGGEQQVLYLARFLKEKGIKQLVVGQPGSEMELRCAAFQIPFLSLAMRAEVDFIAARRLAGLARDYRILHAHTARAHGLGLLAMWMGNLTRAGVRFIVSRRVDFPAAPNFWSRKKYQSPLVHRYVAISKNVERILIADGIGADRISVAYSGVDVDRSPESAAGLKREFSLPRRCIVLGNVAALVPHKDQATLLHAAATLKRLCLDRGIRRSWRLFIVGDGELFASLLALRDGLGLQEDVVFTGFRQDVGAFLSVFDVFVMSSREEGLGTVVLDAMSQGLPVVATAGGGIPEMVVAGRGGWLSPVGDAAALAGALLQAIEDPARRKRYGEFNRRRARKFSFAETGRRNLEIYREVLRS